MSITLKYESVYTLAREGTSSTERNRYMVYESRANGCHRCALRKSLTTTTLWPLTQAKMIHMMQIPNTGRESNSKKASVRLENP